MKGWIWKRGFIEAEPVFYRALGRFEVTFYTDSFWVGVSWGRNIAELHLGLVTIMYRRQL